MGRQLMRKALIIAGTEFANFVRTKAFIISIVLASVLPLIMIGVQRVIDRQADTTERRFAVVDHTGVLGPAIESAAAARNASVSGPPPSGPRFVPVVVRGAVAGDEARVELSEQVGRDELFAFVEIPAGVLDDSTPVRLRYYSSHPTYTALPRWIEQTGARRCRRCGSGRQPSIQCWWRS
jgi:hypothetical protein